MRAVLVERVRRVRLAALSWLSHSLRESGPLPWLKPRYERILLALVGFAALSPLGPIGTQDVTRLCLSQAILHGHLNIDSCAGHTGDHAVYGGHVYTDKAPGLSFLAVPVTWALGLSGTSQQLAYEDARVWIVRLATTGIAFVILAFLVGRVSEGIAPGLGGAVLVAFALGTYMAPLAATMFEHVLAGAFAFGGYLLAWSRRYVLAGLCVAIAVDMDYLCALIAVIVAGYVLVAGARPLLRYGAGAAGPLILLGAYNWAAFGSPFHLSYRYVAGRYADPQSAGLFGIHVPYTHAVGQVFLGDRGILVVSPVLIAAAAGIVLLARRYRLEAIVCAATFVAFVLVNCGYFIPYGGNSPGPRFLAPSLPFIALGLAAAFSRWFRTTALLAAASIVATTALTLTWRPGYGFVYRQTIWGAIARFISDGKHSINRHELLMRNALGWIGIGRVTVAGLVFLAAAAAYALALRGRWRDLRPHFRT